VAAAEHARVRLGGEHPLVVPVSEREQVVLRYLRRLQRL
jgi:hypothetical protein